MYLHIRFINGGSTGEWLLFVGICQSEDQHKILRVHLLSLQTKTERMMDVIVWMAHSTSF